MALQDSPDGSIISQPRCEIAKSILDQECQRPGEVRYGGMFLCAPHARLLELEERAQALLSSVFRMDEWMEENGSVAADDEFVGRIRREREEAVGALRLTHTQLRSAHKALTEQEALPVEGRPVGSKTIKGRFADPQGTHL